MIFSRLLAKESPIGVDIGTNSIKIVQAEPSKHGITITHVAICPTPPDSIKEGVVVDIPAVAAAIQFAMRSAGIKSSSAVAAIAGAGVLARHVQFPKMQEQVLRKTIHFEAGKFISASIEDSVVEFEILGDGDEPGQMKVMLVAAPKAMIDSRVETLEQAGLEPLSVDVEAFAIFRALLEHNPDQSAMNGTVALLDSGASHTEINLVSRGSLALTRTIPIAGVSFTNALKNALSCDDEQAEQAKFAMDLSELASSSEVAQADPGMKVVQGLVDEMIREIRRSINYYQSQLPEGAPDTSVDKLILSGGTSRLRGLTSYMSSRLNMEVMIGNPALGDLASLSSGDSRLSEEDIPLLAVAYGLAVKEIRSPVKMPAAA